MKNVENLEKTKIRLMMDIMEDVITAAKMPFDEWYNLSSSPLVRLSIRASNEEEYRVTQIGINAAHKYSELVWQQREDLRQVISRNEFNKCSFMAIGKVISQGRLYAQDEEKVKEYGQDVNLLYAKLVDDYDVFYADLTSKMLASVDQHIPCHLFHIDQGVSAFSVGPVEFRPRADWIEHYVKNDPSYEHVNAVVSGLKDFKELQEKALNLNNSEDLFCAYKVLQSLGNYSWVASIRMPNHELGQSRHKAFTIIELAMDAIGLLFHADEARRFSMAGREYLFSEDRLATSLKGHFIHGSSIHMPGLSGAPGDLVAIIKKEQNFLESVGKILSAYVQNRQRGAAPHLIERWVNALYWVGQARRERSDFLAVVNYGCAADGLAGAGGKSSEMIKFAKGALDPKADKTQQGFKC